MSNLPDLPPSSDEEFWVDAEKHQGVGRHISICPTHQKEGFMEHRGYVDNHDGTLSCKFCPYGVRLPGYMKLIDGKIRDLRVMFGS